jgi:hypothetical protein
MRLERNIEDIRNVGVNRSHIDIWEARQDRRMGFKDPTSAASLASTLLKNWIKGFDTLYEWIGSHVDDSYQIPLAFMLRYDPKPTFVEPDTPSLDGEYADFCPRWSLMGRRTSLRFGMSRPIRNFGTLCSQFSITTHHPMHTFSLHAVPRMGTELAMP